MKRVVCLLCCLALGGAQAQTWTPGESPLFTRFAADVSPENVHPEYPRPQLRRDAWLNLNGLWEFATSGLDEAQPDAFDQTILVPFPVESALSGVTERVDGRRVWYRRTFSLPADWAEERVLLHFGAVDWDATVRVNGQEVGSHQGGYDPFSFDITDSLTAGTQEIVVSVTDPTDTGTQPRGKQVLHPGGIWYTPTTGIWQTVWLEPVPETHIKGLEMTPDVAAGVLRLTVQANSGEVSATALAEGERVAEVRGGAGETLELPLLDTKLWSPDTPFLYDVQVSLMKDGETVDAVSSYFGMREISLGKDEGGVTRLLLNGEPLFQYGFLDQGFWPDGLYTAPTDEALRYDLEQTKALGFNMVRKHVKVEPARWYYWADTLGLLVWQDMPSGDAFAERGAGEIERSEASAEQFELELQRMVDSLRNHPSVVMWVLFNEGWGQYDTARLTEWLKGYDPTRLVDSASGWNDLGTGDVYDVHAYPGPDAPPPDPNRALVLGEFGGLGLALPGLTWQDESNWGYREFSDRVALMEAYADLVAGLRALVVKRGLSAAVYTQTTDVEVEVNGALTYDRSLAKLEPTSTRWTNRILYRPLPVTTALSPTSEDEGVLWRYTFGEPQGDWTSPDFDDSSWREGAGGFGLPDTRNGVTRTEWTGREVWLRRSFELDNPPHNPFLRVHHDEDADIYLNGEGLERLPYYTMTYVDVPLEDGDAFREGRNLLAVHCKRVGPGAYCDAGLYDTVEQLSLKRGSE